METAVMGRPKAKTARAKPAETKARNRSGEKPTVVTMKGDPAWRDWLEELATFDRCSVAGLIDRAVVHYGRSIGFTKGAPER
jgi:hypothetical protein